MHGFLFLSLDVVQLGFKVHTDCIHLQVLSLMSSVIGQRVCLEAPSDVAERAADKSCTIAQMAACLAATFGTMALGMADL